MSFLLHFGALGTSKSCFGDLFWLFVIGFRSVDILSFDLFSEPVCDFWVALVMQTLLKQVSDDKVCDGKSVVF